MPDKGNRSVEVQVWNGTQADLTVEGPGTSNSWIQGEQAKAGDLLSQFNTSLWGVSTNDALGSTDASLHLVGLGDSPFGIRFMNPFNGKPSCVITPNDSITATVQLNPGDQKNHPSFSVNLAMTGADANAAAPKS